MVGTTISHFKVVGKIGLLVLASVLVTLVLGEAFCRYRDKAWPFEEPMMPMPWLTSKDESLRWRISPGEGRNSLGLKNEEISPKRQNELRILFLGDSLVWSATTSSGELYTTLIESRLNEKLRVVNKRIEVINGGVPGYTTYQELEFLKIYGFGMEPDLVILGFVFNDLYYKYLHKVTEREFLAIEPNVLLQRFDSRSFPGVIFSRSYLAHDLFFGLEVLVRKVIRRSQTFLTATGPTYYEFEHRVDLFLAWKEYGWDRTRTLLREMQALLSKRNIGFAITIFPVSNQVDDVYLRMDRDYVLYPQKRIKAICSDYQISCLDLSEPLHRGGGTSLYEDYLHLNVRGNDVVATEVSNYLTANSSTWFR